VDLHHFSSSQRAVVEASDGPLSVLAGPGSAKTTVLAGRIAYLVAHRGVPAAAILAITFTTAAAATPASEAGGHPRQSRAGTHAGKLDSNVVVNSQYVKGIVTMNPSRTR
jgi:superfamily I DNA/RNA helicase